MRQFPRGTPLPRLEREQLTAAVEKHGERAVLRATGLSRSAMARAAAGWRIYPGTAALVRQGLAKLEDDGARSG